MQKYTAKIETRKPCRHSIAKPAGKNGFAAVLEVLNPFQRTFIDQILRAALTRTHACKNLGHSKLTS